MRRGDVASQRVGRFEGFAAEVAAIFTEIENVCNTFCCLFRSSLLSPVYTFVVMLLLVHIQVVFLSRSEAAQITSKWLLTSVDKPMVLQLIPTSKPAR